MEEEPGKEVALPLEVHQASRLEEQVHLATKVQVHLEHLLRQATMKTQANPTSPLTYSALSAP